MVGVDNQLSNYPKTFSGIKALKVNFGTLTLNDAGRFQIPNLLQPSNLRTFTSLFVTKQDPI
jgi:hypothetical protein